MAQTFELCVLLLLYLLGFSPVRWNLVAAETNQSYCPSACTCSGYAFTVRADCSGQNLHGIPSDLSSFTVQLDLSVNQITRLPDFAFSQYKFLEELRLDGNCLSWLPAQAFTGILHLKTLHLQGNQFTDVPSKALESLYFLQQLHLDANQILTVPADAFYNMPYLKQLWLDANELTAVPREALSRLPALEALTLAVNNITQVEAHSFANNRKMVVVLLHTNNIGIIDEKAFGGLADLKTLELQNNKLKSVPMALRDLPQLTELDLSGNKINHIPDGAFTSNKELKLIHLSGNPILSLGTFAFTQLPYLEKLVIANIKEQKEFPSLQGTGKINTLKLSGGRIDKVPENLCDLIPGLTSLDLHSNKIKNLPDLSSCTKLKILNFAENEISSLESTPFRNLHKLTDLNISNNLLTELQFDAFHGLQSLLYLELQNNHLSNIDRDAFGSLTSLQDLNLANNHIPSLPTKGLVNLRSLKIDQNYEMRAFPSVVQFPVIQSVQTSYTYHCCHFMNEGKFLVSSDLYVPVTMNWTDLSDFPSNPMYSGEARDRDRRSLAITRKVPVQCTPEPGPLMPCNNLIEWWSLRVGVWLIFLVGAVGCACIILVTVAQKRKVDTNKFLVCNLACGNLCVAVYLGLLTSVDASTIGQFESSAIGWQFGLGCKASGFLAVFGTQLSVFTLLLITVERVYAIIHAGDLQKRVPLRHAACLVSFIWLVAVLFASLPLIHVSSYSKYAICLPMEIGDVASKVYVCILVAIDGAVFMIMIACYIQICVSLKGTGLVSLHDSRVTKRMAVLIFTDLICWLPIMILTLAAAGFGHVLIGATATKVMALFVFPLNCCANPLLYITLTKQFRLDCISVCGKKRNHYTDTEDFIRVNKTCNLKDYVEDGSNTTRLEPDSVMKMRVSCFHDMSEIDHLQIRDLDEDSGWDDDLHQCSDHTYYHISNARECFNSFPKSEVHSCRTHAASKCCNKDNYPARGGTPYEETIPLKELNYSQIPNSDSDLWERRHASSRFPIGGNRYEKCWQRKIEVQMNPYDGDNKDEQNYVPMLDSTSMLNGDGHSLYLNFPNKETEYLSRESHNVSLCEGKPPECLSKTIHPSHMTPFNVGLYPPKKQQALSPNYLLYDPEHNETQDQISPLQSHPKSISRQYMNIGKYPLDVQCVGEDEGMSSSSSSVALQRDSGYSVSGSGCDSSDSCSNTEMELAQHQKKEIIVDCCSTI